MKYEENPKLIVKNKKRIMIVDDRPYIREGLIQIINRESDMQVCAEVGGIDDAVKAVTEGNVSIALIDMLLDSITGIQVIEKIKIISPDIIFLVFSMSDNPLYLKKAIEVGARGYISKDEISEKIIIAIRQVLKGKIYISRHLLMNLTKKERMALLSGTEEDRVN